ncbi:hypothetical protein D3C77_265140 [compost metagenome]
MRLKLLTTADLYSITEIERFTGFRNCFNITKDHPPEGIRFLELRVIVCPLIVYEVESGTASNLV